MLSLILDKGNLNNCIFKVHRECAGHVVLSISVDLPQDYIQHQPVGILRLIGEEVPATGDVLPSSKFAHDHIHMDNKKC